MTRTSDERVAPELRSWLGASIDDLPSGSELPPEIRGDVLSRLPGTPQRRRWWPFRWFPFGFGATRSGGAKGPRVEGRTKSMFSSTQAIVAATVLALVGGFAFLAVPTDERAVTPGAETQEIDPTAFGGFSGTRSCSQGQSGEITNLEWGTLTTGETYPRCAIRTSDPRMSGNSYSVHDYYRYDGQPRWGVRNLGDVITNADGTWVNANGWGYQQPEDGTMVYAGMYRGTGAYEGLTALTISTQDEWGLRLDIEGVIFPGELPAAPDPPIDAASAAD